MTAAFEKLVDWAGGREAVGNTTILGRLIRFQAGVARSGEFRRIAALPRRRWDEAQDLDELTELLTERLKKPGGTMSLWRVQAAALRECYDVGGGFFPVSVGRGKTVISLLASVVMEAERPVLFVPARLRDQTRRILPELSRHWRLHSRLRIIGYSELSLAKNANMLDRINPDLIILDEVHRVRAKNSGRTKRLIRWFREHPETRCVAMSGTVTKRSIRDYAHILQWCLKDDLCPVPTRWQELCDWADAIDADVPDHKRVAPGALADLCVGDETVRQGYQRRLTETPGVVASVGEDDVDASLVVAEWPVIAPGTVTTMLAKLRDSWETPNGDLVTEAPDLWRHAREIALGFWYRWDPPAPRDWMEARRAWKRYVRETLKNNRRGLDTELQVWNECERNFQAYEEHNVDDPYPPELIAWSAWRGIRNTFKPNTVAEWMTDEIVQQAAEWLRDGGICWVEHVAFGQRLSRAAGVPYFGAGDDGIGVYSGPCVASIRAHGEGKNLQHYSRCLVVAPPPAGDTWEQLLGRLHRSGQQADEVTYEVYLGCDELRDGFRQALADAKYLESTLGARQKLLYADVAVKV